MQWACLGLSDMMMYHVMTENVYRLFFALSFSNSFHHLEGLFGMRLPLLFQITGCWALLRPDIDWFVFFLKMHLYSDVPLSVYEITHIRMRFCSNGTALDKSNQNTQLYLTSMTVIKNKIKRFTSSVLPWTVSHCFFGPNCLFSFHYVRC